MAEHGDAAEQVDEQTPPDEEPTSTSTTPMLTWRKMLKCLHRSGFQTHAH